MRIANDQVFHKTQGAVLGQNSLRLLIDPARPNWAVTDERGAALLERFDGRRRLGEVVRDYAAERGLDWAKAWQHVETLARDGLRHGLLAERPRAEEPYPGRQALLGEPLLEELWLHTNNSCNLVCGHCLVSSGPEGQRGLSTAAWLDIIDQARAMGAKRFYITGGEPLLRRDLPELASAILKAADETTEVALLTNGMLLRGPIYEGLLRLDRRRLRWQISLDGATAKENDALRGQGSFEAICAGIRRAVDAGLDPTITTVITATSLCVRKGTHPLRAQRDPSARAAEITRLVAQLGARRQHLLFWHRRGRALAGANEAAPSVSETIAAVRAAVEAGDSCGVTIDNLAAWQARLDVPAGVKRDLSGAGVNSLCVYADGRVYPSAALADIPELLCGDASRRPLAEVWRDSPVLRRFRAASLKDKPHCPGCPLRFLCGGGDIEQAYGHGGDILAHDPYCELHQDLIAQALERRAQGRLPLLAGRRAGQDGPLIYAAMGALARPCAAEASPAVVTSHSGCVDSYDLEPPREAVRAFYGRAAREPQAELCCPVRPAAEELAHIPAEVVERFYGCGSPMARARIQAGETTLDLGSGAGIDVFIAARHVGPQGRALGVDMTEDMLAVARANAPRVAQNLGYDVTDFRHGFLEAIPAADRSVDLLTSNCVINLSPDKPRVFAEMARVLKDHGRMVISDIVAEREVPAHQRRDPRLWGECISGALTEEELLALLERAGFHGLEVLARSFWKEVEGLAFHSLTLRGYKYEKTSGCVFEGHEVVYLGPYKGVADEEGHYFPRGLAVAVCTDTVAKLSHPPYAGQFIINVPGAAAREAFNCQPRPHPAPWRGIETSRGGFDRGCDSSGRCC